MALKVRYVQASRNPGPELALMLEALLEENPGTEPVVLWADRWSEDYLDGTLERMAALVLLKPVATLDLAADTRAAADVPKAPRQVTAREYMRQRAGGALPKFADEPSG